ncbi:MAG: hypothetical protein JOY85_05705, partial [Acidobacteriaceae bacterium]|nr:hypothetical protein [Acidobacteriaceae bacterium]
GSVFDRVTSQEVRAAEVTICLDQPHNLRAQFRVASAGSIQGGRQFVVRKLTQHFE